MGPLIALFWTSCDPRHGLQSQGGSLTCTLTCLRAMNPRVTSGATPVFSTNRGVHCTSVYKFTFSNKTPIPISDEQINYIRDCSTKKNLGESCINTNVQDTSNPMIPLKVCYYICNTDGCNTSHKHSATVSLIIVSSVTATFLLKRIMFFRS